MEEDVLRQKEAVSGTFDTTSFLCPMPKKEDIFVANLVEIFDKNKLLAKIARLSSCLILLTGRFLSVFIFIMRILFVYSEVICIFAA